MAKKTKRPTAKERAEGYADMTQRLMGCVSEPHSVGYLQGMLAALDKSRAAIFEHLTIAQFVADTEGR